MNGNPSAERQGRASAQGRTGVQVGTVEPYLFEVRSPVISALLDQMVTERQARTGEDAETARRRIHEVVLREGCSAVQLGGVE